MKTEYETAAKVLLSALVSLLLFCTGIKVRAGQEDAVMFQIQDAELLESSAQGGASLKGARILIWRLAEEPAGSRDERPDDGTDGGFGNWKRMKKTFVTEVSTDESGTAVLRGLPAGKYLVRQSLPSKGYLPDTGCYAEFLVSQEGTITPGFGFHPPDDGHGFPYVLIRQQIKRADLRIIKEKKEGERVSGIVFEISLLGADGKVMESHRYVTDKNGTIDTASRKMYFCGNRQMIKPGGALVFGLYRIIRISGNEKEDNAMIFYTDASGNVADPAEYFENGITYTVMIP